MKTVRYLLSRVKKAVGALLGAAVGTQVDWITNNILQFDLTTETDAAIAVLLAALGAYLAPKNAPKRATAPTP